MNGLEAIKPTKLTFFLLPPFTLLLTRKDVEKTNIRISFESFVFHTYLGANLKKHLKCEYVFLRHVDFSDMQNKPFILNKHIQCLYIFIYD